MWKYIGIKECNKFLLSLNLFECKNEKKYIRTLYSISNRIEDNYKIFKIKKHNGKYRTIHEPNKLLKHIQTQILNNILNNKSISKYATAYHKGKSLKDNAIPHLNKKMLLKLDINDFFDNITFLNIYNSCFSIEYFPKSVGMLLTTLCTYEDHLTQGSPTSSYISNLVMKDFDEEVGSWCEKKNISYTRYSDDMTFSGDFNVKEVINIVKTNLKKIGLQLNNDKIHVIKSNYCQNVTGVVVNKKMQVKKSYRNKIRQELFYIKKYGIDSHLEKKNIIDKNTYLNSLYGRILFVLQINKDDNEFINYKNIIFNLIKN